MQKIKTVIILYFIILFFLNGQVIFNYSPNVYFEPICYFFLIILSIVLFFLVKRSETK